MSQVEVYSMTGSKIGRIELPEDIFGAEILPELFNDVVKWQLAGRRQGTHMTKTKGLVSGGGKKPFKQKGTGNARQGSSRSPLMPGGGTIFGPTPRSYAYVLPRKVRKKALISALSYLYSRGLVRVVDEVVSNGKTKELQKALLGLGLEKGLVLGGKSNELASRACKNLTNFSFRGIDGANVYDLLKLDGLVIEREAVDKLASRLRGN